MSHPITANSAIGRILLALRAGRMSCEAIAARFPSGYHYLAGMQRTGHITRVDDGYVITAAGLQACPSRSAAPREPLHESLTSKSRKHGGSSTRKGAAA